MGAAVPQERRTPDLADGAEVAILTVWCGPQFQSVVFVHQDTVRLFYLSRKKNWHILVLVSFDLREAAPKEVVERLRGRTFSF